MSLSVTVNGEAILATTGDPEIAPLMLPAAGGLAGATLLQDGDRFSLTNITINCNNLLSQTGCGFLFTVSTVDPLNFPAGTAALTVDGSVTTTRPDPTGIFVNTSMWATSGYTPNPYGYLVYTFGGGLNDLTTGDFDGAWYQDARFEGPVSGVYFSLTISGLQNGDSLTMPGSMGLDLAIPEVSSVPEPCSFGLFLGVFAVVGMRRVIVLSRRHR